MLTISALFTFYQATPASLITEAAQEHIGKLNTHFLLATRPYIPKVALARIRECREDIWTFGLEYAQHKWAKFFDKEGGNATPPDA